MIATFTSVEPYLYVIYIHFTRNEMNTRSMTPIWKQGLLVIVNFFLMDNLRYRHSLEKKFLMKDISIRRNNSLIWDDRNFRFSSKHSVQCWSITVINFKTVLHFYVNIFKKVNFDWLYLYKREPMEFTRLIRFIMFGLAWNEYLIGLIFVG